MSRFDAPIAALRRPLPMIAIYWLCATGASAVLFGGSFFQFSNVFNGTLSAMLCAALWLIRRPSALQGARA